ncbi:MAG TPA: TIM-barrel domain-containing protein [Steroidobacteraceae bacterium]|jgi:alpha-glucosidase (family GH31 glycosyl hydrolase)|nr:TIM-barrel domain-containing protein [Steroidobacteraceae bacterium]
MNPVAVRNITAAWVLTVALLALPCAARAQGTTQSVAGSTRFEFLTPTLVRMEYSPGGKFVDAPTAVVLRRQWSAVPVERSEKDGWLILSTSAMTLRYRLGSGAFTAANLKVTWKDHDGAGHSWQPGDTDAGNLGGLTYSLDNIAAANLPKDQMDLASPVNDSIPGIDFILPQAKPGLLSRSGYAFLDDSTTPLWNAQGTWIVPRARQDALDWYLFVYQRDYARVLREYAQLCGPIPMVPRYVLGAWITDFNFEYFPGTAESARPDFRRYNQQYLIEEVSRMRRSHIPFDALVLDFAWHNYGWQGGYDWSPLFPHPAELMSYLRAQGVKLSLNDHPGYIHTDESILSYNDSHAAEVLRALGRSPPVKPSFDLDVSQGWSFATDAHDVGLSEKWYAAARGGVAWRAVRTGLSWQEQGYKDYQGPGWYRTVLHLPPKLPAALYLYLGEVSASYRIFINGQEAKHSYDHWPRRVTYTDLIPYVSAGQDVQVVLRVEPEKYGSGILRGPVALRDVRPPERVWFDLSDQKQADVFMKYLHGPLMQQGVDLWWVDGGSGAVSMPGLNEQLWTNKVFYDYSEQQSGKRAFILGRYGDWGSERYPGYFTGDTYSEWPVLAYEVAFSARGGNVLVPYISHDIGGFHGAKIDFELYARWLEFGAFSGILRMHSAHENPREGNLRMPWVYGQPGIDIVRKYFALRTQLLPYLYTYTWLAHKDATPLLRPLYLEHPDLEEAYRHPHEYFLGDEMLVAPVVAPGASHTVYLPPGQWRNFFSGERHAGDASFTAHYALDETPVFVREGALIPEQPPSEFSDQRPLDHLIVSVYGAANGVFDLYEDDGSTLAYDKEQAHTKMTHTANADGSQTLVIAATQGNYRGQPQERSYELHVYGAERPHAVAANGQETRWTWDAKRGAATIQLPARSIREPLRIDWH